MLFCLCQTTNRGHLSLVHNNKVIIGPTRRSVSFPMSVVELYDDEVIATFAISTSASPWHELHGSLSVACSWQ